MTFQDHFSGHAATYASARPTYPRALAELLAELAPHTGTAWDCGCGSGQLSTLLAERFERVLATDASAEQLRNAARHPRVEYRQAPAESSGLVSGTVDLTTVAQAAHWFDLPRFYAEVRRVSRGQGSVLALVSYGRHSVSPDVDELVERFYSGPLARHWPPERALVEAGYATLPFPFPRLVVPPFSMEVAWDVGAVLAYIGTWSAVARLVREEGPAQLDALAADVRAAWGSVPVRLVRWPLAVLVGRVGPGTGTSANPGSA